MFQLGGAPYRFGIQKFALVTGFRFGKIRKYELNFEGEKAELPNHNICMLIWPDNGRNAKPDDIVKALHNEKLVVEDVKGLILVARCIVSCLDWL